MAPTASAWFDEESSESDASFNEAELAAALLARRGRGVRSVVRQPVGAPSAATAATKRAAKTRTDAQRKADAKSSAHEAGLPRVPRPLALLRTLSWFSELVAREDVHEGTYVSRVDSKANAEVLMSEQCEVLPQPVRFMVSGGVHPKSGLRPCSTLFKLDVVCIHPKCGFLAKWKRIDGGGGGGGARRPGVFVIEDVDGGGGGGGGGGARRPGARRPGVFVIEDVDGGESDEADRGACFWELQRCFPHDELCGLNAASLGPAEPESGAPKKHRIDASAYSTAVLARAVAAAQVSRCSKMSMDAAKQVLAPLLQVPPSSALAQRVRAAAEVIVFGTVSDNFLKLPSLIRELQRAGFFVEVQTADWRKMNVIARESAKAEHAAHMKGLPKERHFAFDYDKVKGREAFEGETFITGWTVLFPTTQRGLVNGVLDPVASGDFAGGRGSGASGPIGNFGGSVGQDADRRIIPKAFSWTCLNESKASWKDLIKPMMIYYPQLRLDNAIFLLDGDKGGHGALAEEAPDLTAVTCREHRGKTAAKKFGKGTKVRCASGRLLQSHCMHRSFTRTSPTRLR
ncbi:hypothetical protein M885DRAFT_535662 [Pelagophyceae sp. CCMP2097]|nr:hypothetical protein M885DRAFT_535662 [Pelagophyceae sp. CCMP2097]